MMITISLLRLDARSLNKEGSELATKKVWVGGGRGEVAKLRLH